MIIFHIYPRSLCFLTKGSIARKLCTGIFCQDSYKVLGRSWYSFPDFAPKANDRVEETGCSIVSRLREHFQRTNSGLDIIAGD